MVHLYIPKQLTVACGEFNHCVKHSVYKNRLTCPKCLKIKSAHD